MNTDIFYINLDRRPDRKVQVEAQLQRHGLHGQRVAAVDGALPVAGAETQFLGSGEVACWMSHQKVFEFIANGSAPLALILEDDAVLCESVDWREVLLGLPSAFAEHSLDLLQLGFIESRYQFKLSPTRLTERYLELRQRYRLVNSSIGHIRLFEFRIGTHAYVVTKEAAQRLVGTNMPVVQPADNFFSQLAETQDGRNYFRVARVVESKVSQFTRGSGSAALDSDVA